MREGQINSLIQAEELFESAKTNQHHLELAKYLVINMNSIFYAFKKGWMDKASESDIEYGTKYVKLRDEYCEILFPGSEVTNSQFEDFNGEYSPKLGTPDELLEAIKSGYDFSTETGIIIFNTIYTTFKFSVQLTTSGETSEQSNKVQEIVSVMDELKKNI